MKINEDSILEDAEKIFELTQSPSYSKNCKLKHDLDSINFVYSKLHSKYFDLLGVENSYYEKLSLKDYYRNISEYGELLGRYMDYHFRIAETGARIFDENNLYIVPYAYKKTYGESEIKEMLLDFFNEKGKYKFVKSLFDEERIGISNLKDTPYEGICINFLSNINPYILIDSKNDNLNLFQVSNLAHEIGHAIEGTYGSKRINAKYCDVKNMILREVCSIFYEIEFLRYLQINGINLKDTNRIINTKNLKTLLSLKDLKNSYVDSLSFKEDDIYVSENDEFLVSDNYNIVKKFISQSTNEEVAVELSVYYPLLYGLGGYIGLYLTELRKQNSKEFDRIWNDFISMRTLLTYEDVIDMFGLDSEEFLSGKVLESIIKKDFNACTKTLKK